MARRSVAEAKIVVTGASSGIGRALVTQLAQRGAYVVAVARREARLTELASALQNTPGAVLPVRADITAASDRSRILQSCSDHFGGLDILVNNAGVSARGRFASASANRGRQIMEANYFAAVDLIREALPLLDHSSRPMIVNVGSILGFRGIPHNSEYCASKFALHGFTQALRSELKPRGVHVLLAAPGTTKTELAHNLLEKTNPLPWKEKAGVSPERVAKQIVQAIERKRQTIIPSWPGRFLVITNRWAPQIIDRIMNRYG